MNDFELLKRLGTTCDTGGNATGTWRYFRPVLADRQPPCAAVCPAGNNIREFMRLAGEKDFFGALAAVKKENPLPSVCGRVCHHPCTTACSRNDIDAPLAVNLIERRLGDMVQPDNLCLPAPRVASGRTVAVVGAGPAGLACAYHAALLGHGVTLFESGPAPGGMLRRGIPAYRLPREAIGRDLLFIDALNIKLICNHSITTLDELASFDAVCVALGAHEGRALGIPGADENIVLGGLDFLEMVNTGAAPDVGRRALIIGGGNTAVDCARAALRLSGAATVCYRRAREDMPALPDEIMEAAEEGVAFVFHASPVRVITENGRAVAVKFVRTEPGESGPDGRRAFVPVAGSEFMVEADTIIAAVGEIPVADWLPGPALEAGGSLKTNPFTLEVRGGVRAGLFAAGDAAGGSMRTVSHAIGAGKRAAVAMDLFLNKKMDQAGEILNALTIGNGDVISARRYCNEDFTAVNAVARDSINPARIEVMAPVAHQRKPAAGRARGFDEVHEGLEPDAAAAEARRCITCGACTSCGTCLLFCPEAAVLQGGGGRAGFDYEYCKGCGICIRECPRAAIEMIEEDK